MSKFDSDKSSASLSLFSFEIALIPGCASACQAYNVLKTTLSSKEVSDLSRAAHDNVSQGGFNANIRAFGPYPHHLDLVHTAPPTFKSSTRDDPSLGTTSPASADEVRVMRIRGVGDKKGQRHQIMHGRTVSTRFGPNTVSAYLEVVRSALSLMMDRLANTSFRASENTSSDAPPRGKVTGIISYSEELSRNVVRSGVPPPLPKYTRVAMWRGESVCLDQMGAGDMEEEIVAGINWCEAKTPSERVDLDLSVMVSHTKFGPSSVEPFVSLKGRAM